ncbi:tetratricopeptide repeat-containing protein [Sphingobium sp.]|uniref:tetratricopeptide repeat-containing protein n=1 Tax=Sphingobium sp. TaxID=1912891 RepID=UPI0026058027|nr:tetratricopeptide repeat-containing protein [Sphingobium sp.]
MTYSILAQIRRVARSGASARAWRLFCGEGLEASDDPDVLSLKGRLLKDRAGKSADGEKEEFLLLAQQAYLAAARAGASTYPLINAATLSLFRGRLDEAQTLAREVMHRLDSGQHDPETPYWLDATRAEAAFILDDRIGGEHWIAQARNTAPRAWEDHAATVRQVRQILKIKGLPEAILDPLRPPPSLFFDGIIGLPENEGEAHDKISMALDSFSPGAVYGALAAGSDILIAEVAVDSGAELHIILPTDLQRFRATSVIPFGHHWASRFDRLIDRADSLYTAGRGQLSDAAVVKASQIAMGLAVQRSQLLETKTIGLHVGRSADPDQDKWPRWGKTAIERHVVSIEDSYLPDCPALAKSRNRVAVAWTLRATDEAEEPTCAAAPMMVDDIDEAMQYIDGLFARYPDAAVALDYCTLDPDPGADPIPSLAILLSKSAPPGSLCVQWPDAAVISLFAPEWHFEVAGEVMTNQGDIEVALHFPVTD